jgi:hypothetical protein
MASLTNSLLPPTTAAGEGSSEKIQTAAAPVDFTPDIIRNCARESLPEPAAAKAKAPDEHTAEALAANFAALQLRASNTDKESLDFDLDIDRRQRYSTAHRSRRCWGYSGRLCGKWFLTVVLGLTVGLIAFLMSSLIEKIQLAKLRWVEREFNPCTAPGACAELSAEARGALLRPWAAGAALCGVNAALAVAGAARLAPRLGTASLSVITLLGGRLSPPPPPPI